MNIHLAICDDEDFFIEDLLDKLKECAAVLKNVTVEIDTFIHGETLLDKMKTNKYDIVLLDIKLNNLLGTEVGIELKKYNPNLLLIYMSSYDCYYTKLVKAEPFDFLHKPFIVSDLKKTLEKAIERLNYFSNDYFYTYKSNGVNHTIDLKNVVYFESQHRLINAHCKESDTFQFYEKLNKVEKEISDYYPYFIRVNQSFYVNFNYITSCAASTVTLNNEYTIKISPKYKQSFEEKYRFLYKKLHK